MYGKMTNIRNESGVIMIIVIMLSMVLTIITISILGISVSQVTSSTGVVDAIVAEQLAKGTLFLYHQYQMEGCPCPTPGDCSTCVFPDEVINGRTFDIDVLNAGGGTGPNGADPLSITVTY